MHRFLLSAAIAAVLLLGFAAPQTATAESEQWVLVTGASTGIGRNLAETLAESGYHVYAGARSDEDLEALDAIDNITAVRLDVTKQDQVDAAVDMIQKSGTGLYGLVNNAGVGGGGKVLETPVAGQTFVYRVNVEGVYRTTKAFAPLVAEQNGRIVTTGSIAGTMSWAGGNAYSGSKHWIEAFTDALAAEMEPLGVHVSVVEPGNFKSRIRRSAVSRAFAQVEAAGGEITEDMQQFKEATVERELSYKEPDEVSEAFMHALFSEKPLRRYVVTPDEEEHVATIRTKLTELVQLNQWGPYSHSRDELVEMLDEILSGGTTESVE
jgi:NAD(P)-dependent dehydrogenase (short-subunit alcohol dehydrogenase family)